MPTRILPGAVKVLDMSLEVGDDGLRADRAHAAPDGRELGHANGGA